MISIKQSNRSNITFKHTYYIISAEGYANKQNLKPNYTT